jgi:hypothetical protein
MNIKHFYLLFILQLSTLCLLGLQNQTIRLQTDIINQLRIAIKGETIKNTELSKSLTIERSLGKDKFRPMITNAELLNQELEKRLGK